MKKFYEKWLSSLVGNVYNERLRQNVLQALPYWIASLITGFAAVLYTKMFVFSENLSFAAFHSHTWLIFILTPACFVSAWWMVKRFDKNAGGSGIPQVMAAIELANPRYNYLVDRLLSTKTIVVKIISSLLMILGGGAIGKEGPTIQIAGSIFRKVNQLMPASWPKISKKNMIMTGAAAGLAAAFNTPLGGIVFAVEELGKTHINYFKTALFTAVIIAGLTAQGMLGPYLYLGYPDVTNLSHYIFFFVIIVAALAGILGSLMSKAILKLVAWKKSFQKKKFELFYVIGCALVVATIAYLGGHGILGSGKSYMSRILFTTDKHVSFELPFLRTIGTAISFTTGAAGGVFAPSLSAGATLGALFGQLAHQSAANTNVLILAGMVGFLTGVTYSPFTSAILVLEMTDRHNVIFHLMLAGMVASFFSLMIDKHSLYDHLKDNYLKDAYREDQEEGGNDMEHLPANPNAIIPIVNTKESE